jgi:hypothetical protein
MCYTVFVASPAELPLVPATDPLLFSIDALEDHHLGVHQHFPSGWNIRHVGSSSGCSCELRGDGSGPSRAAFGAYLAALPAKAPAMIYTCWNGYAADPSEERIDATVADLMADDQLIAERRLISLIRA